MARNVALIGAGGDVGKLPSALQGGRSDSAALQEYMPRLANSDYTPTGRIDIMVQDLDAAQDLGRARNTALPLTSARADAPPMLTATGPGGADQEALKEYCCEPDRSKLQ